MEEEFKLKPKIIQPEKSSIKNTGGVMTLFDAKEYDKRFPLEIIQSDGQVKVLKPEQKGILK